MIKSAPLLAALLLGTAPARSAPVPSRTESAPATVAAKPAGVTPVEAASHVTVGPSLERTRLLHEAGDPDSKLSVPAARLGDGAELGVAVEVHDVVLKALTPSPLKSVGVDRPTGDFHALDATGRPYQLSIGAKLTF